MMDDKTTQAMEAARDAAAASLDAKVRRLASARADVELAKQAYERELAKYPVLAAMQNTIKEAKEREQVAYDALASAALESYAEMGNKQPHEKVTVKITTRREYDAQTAETWARDNAAYMLMLDAKKFDAALKTGLALEFVTTTEEPKAYIAKDLD